MEEIYVEYESNAYYSLSPKWITWDIKELSNGRKIAKMVYIPYF